MLVNISLLEGVTGETFAAPDIRYDASLGTIVDSESKKMESFSYSSILELDKASPVLTKVEKQGTSLILYFSEIIQNSTLTVSNLNNFLDITGLDVFDFTGSEINQDDQLGIVTITNISFDLTLATGIKIKENSLMQDRNGNIMYDNEEEIIISKKNFF